MAVEVNQADWNGLSDDDRKKIEEIISDNFKGETITASDAAAASAAGNPACEMACSIAQAAAMNACRNLPSPGAEICMIAARAAGDACRSRC